MKIGYIINSTQVIFFQNRASNLVPISVIDYQHHETLKHRDTLPPLSCGTHLKQRSKRNLLRTMYTARDTFVLQAENLFMKLRQVFEAHQLATNKIVIAKKKYQRTKTLSDTRRKCGKSARNMCVSPWVERSHHCNRYVHQLN